MKSLSFILASVLFVAGCGQDGEDNQEPFSQYSPTVEQPVEFRLPGGKNTIQITQGTDANGKRVFNQSAFSPPGKWVIYMASAPWVVEGSSNFTGRGANDMVTGRRIMDFLEENNLRDQVEFIWMQYDALPRSKAEGWGGMTAGSKLPIMLHMKNTQGIFDRYVISQAARYPNQSGLLYSDWIRPFPPVSG